MIVNLVIAKIDHHLKSYAKKVSDLRNTQTFNSYQQFSIFIQNLMNCLIEQCRDRLIRLLSLPIKVNMSSRD